MDLQVTYDSSAASAPSWFTSAVSSVVSQFDALITNPITVKIDLGWGEENGQAIDAGAVADNQSNGTDMSYGALTGALAASAATASDRTAVASLPSADFTNGGKFYVPLAEQRALGVQTSAAPDGYVGLSSSVSWTFSPDGQIAAGSFDAVGVLEHEVSEVLGRVDYAGQGSATGTYTPEDLFRYSAAGQRSLTSGSGDFSIDGQSMLEPFGNTADASDWNASVIGDVFGNATQGIADRFSANDLTLLDVLGYSVDPQAVAATATVSATTASTQAAAAPSRTVVDVNSDVDGSTGSQTFVFRPHPGDASVSGLIVSGTNQDTLSFSKTSFSSLADVLRHTTMNDGDAVIHVSQTDAVWLYGVTKSDLRQNPSDLKLHP